MKIEAISPKGYLDQVPEDRKEPMKILRQTILDHLPDGFQETISYGMIGYVVPHSIYPDGYHCDPSKPLPFMSIANQKNYIALYHMGLYADQELLDWFTKAYASVSKTKLDMGKSCIRFKKPKDIPYELIGELVGKVGVQDWIDQYETHIKR